MEDRVTAYLFIGGPWDGRWQPTPRVDVLRVPLVGYDSHGPWMTGEVLYYPVRYMVPGWLIPLTFYVPSVTTNAIPDGTALPGYMVGAFPDVCPVGPGAEFDLVALHRAVRAFNAERLAR